MRIKQIKFITYELMKQTKLTSIFNTLKIIKILLFDFGYFKSAYKMRPVDKDGNPIPWFSYPAIEYLNNMDMRKMSVFEYGSGNSTIFWAKKSKRVTSVESDKKWFIPKDVKHKNIERRLESTKKRYINSISANNLKYDVVVIDGQFRHECVKKSIDHVNKSGFIIIDNSEWYQKSCNFLAKKGFTEINFSGFYPSNPYTSTTSFFINKKYKYKRIDVNKLAHIGRIFQTNKN